MSDRKKLAAVPLVPRTAKASRTRGRFYPSALLLIVVILLLVLAGISGCTPKGAPEGDQPSAGDEQAGEVEDKPQPSPSPTPTATPEPHHEPMKVEDDTDDRVSCQTCQLVEGQTLVAVVDITSVEVEHVEIDGECFHVFRIEFGRVETFTKLFMGGVEFLEPNRAN